MTSAAGRPETSLRSAVAVPSASRRPALGRRVVDVVDDRMGIKALDYPVPAHANTLAWSLGGLTAVSLGVLIITGVLLVQFYIPDPTQANQSVRSLTTEVPGGAFVRGIHFWAAQSMYVLAGLHLIRVFLTSSYKKPREGNWLVGVAMFALTFVAIFTGTVLKWDQEGFEALGHNVESAKELGAAGWWFTPTFAPDTPILTRVYGAHVVLIPGLILLLLFVHVLLIKRHRISPHPLLPDEGTGQAPAREATEPFTRHLRRISAFGLVLIGILALLTLVRPPGVGTPPVEGVEFTRPMWPFWPMFTLENWLGVSGILWGGAGLFGVLALVPFVDRNPARHPRHRKVALTLGALFLLGYVVLTVLMLVLPAKEHLEMGM
ncbi:MULTISPECIES: cytochrome b N-terminal domain-containing protein [unclassified Nocardioides]|uniref:cytochrome b N-terminal domain-containing protein n=1 Tax=unclassified Nocardioides TaxID=2615069 RepID=UPI0011236F95|nr:MULTISPECIES: cytochrome b N-terminal domain-containing protein [unclassified Nocardioides]